MQTSAWEEKKRKGRERREKKKIPSALLETITGGNRGYRRIFPTLSSIETDRCLSMSFSRTSYDFRPVITRFRTRFETFDAYVFSNYFYKSWHEKMKKNVVRYRSRNDERVVNYPRNTPWFVARCDRHRRTIDVHKDKHTPTHTHTRTHVHILFCVLEPCVFQSYNRNNRFLELFVIVLYLWNSFTRSYHTFRAPDTLNLGLLPCPSCHPFPRSTRIPRRVELTPSRRASSASQKSQPLSRIPVN